MGAVGRRARPDEQMAVLGHQHIGENFETQFRAEIVEGLDEFAPEAVGVKNARPPINVFGQVVVVTLPVEAPQTRHRRSLAQGESAAYIKIDVCATLPHLIPA